MRAGLLISPASAFLANALFTGLLDLFPFVAEPCSGTDVVLLKGFAGLPSLGSASTVTLILHGLNSPAFGVSITIDLLGVALRRGVLRGDGLMLFLVLRDCAECGTNGDEGKVIGSGDASRSRSDVVTSLMRAMTAVL